MQKSNIVLTAIAAMCGVAMSSLTSHAALPSGYTELEYLSMSGNGAANSASTPLKFWLDTGISINRDSTVEIAFAYDELEDASYQSCLFWTSGSNGETAFWAYTPSRNNHALAAVKGGYYELSYVLEEGAKHVFKMSNGDLYVDGDNFATHSQTGSLGSNLVLFGSYYGRGDTVPTSRGYDGKFYYARVLDSSNAEVMNLVPARRNSDGVVGAYDTAAGRFLTNQGSGTFTAGPYAPIDPANYSYAMTIKPNTGRITSALVNFPLLVRLSTTRQSWFDPADCGTNGADLRFALSDGTLLAHEIDTWNASGESTVWVNVPLLAADTEIVAYWGVKDASAAPQVTASDAWPDYFAVYHLGEGGTIAYDSSANGFDATNAAAVALGSSPIVGGCARISAMYTTGVTNMLAPDAVKPLSDRSRVTFSSWVAIDSFNTSSADTYVRARNSRIEIARKFVKSGNGYGGFSCRYFANNNYGGGSPNPLYGIFLNGGTGNSNNPNWNTTAPESNGNWFYLTCTVDGATVAKYLNGTLISDTDGNPQTLAHGILGPDPLPLDFGATDSTTTLENSGGVVGRMDEVRIRDGAVSAAYAAADYAQQTDAAFLTYTAAADRVFTVYPVPDQIVATPAALLAGVEPSVTISNRMSGTALVLNTDYTVAYSNNTAIGTAYATVTGIGTYDGYSTTLSFKIDCDLDPSNYAHTMTIAPAAGRITSPLANFPILVRLSTARQPWFNPADCAPNGADLRFALSDGTILAHEIDTWNPSGESLVWVNIPSLSASTVINAYWGATDPAFAPSVNPTDTWPDFVAVYHLGEGDATAYDSSANGYTAVNAAAVSPGSNPKIGGCARITGYYNTTVTSLVNPDAVKPLADRSRLTISAWIAFDAYAEGANQQNSNISIGKKYHGWNTNNGGFDCRFFEWHPCFGLVLNSGGGKDFHNWYDNPLAPSKSSGNWIYLTCTVDGSTAAKYFNGTLFAGPQTFTHGILGPDLDGYYYSFGASQATGRMDEVRLRDGVASAAWIAADYAQQNDANFLAYAEEVDEAFAVMPIPDQTVSSIAELFAGVTPSVTVSNLTTSTELTLGTDYTVTYAGNTSIGLAYAIVAGRGEYAAYTNSAPFLITGLTEYFIIGGSATDGADNSTVSGTGSNPTGWSATKDSSIKAINGITAENAIYHVWLDRLVRTQPGGSFATKPTSTIIVEPSCTWTLADKIRNGTLTLSNLVIRAGGKLAVSPYGDGAATYNNTYAGNWTMEEGASVIVNAMKSTDNTIKQMTISAAVTGRGAISMPSSHTEAEYDGVLANKITGDLTGFTGDIGTWNGYNAVSLELVNAVSLPGDPTPEEIAYVVVTNSATLKVDNDWVSPTNRIWILGDARTPTIEVPSGKTVTIDGGLVGSVGFVKKGAGTLVIRSASPDFSGEITISAGKVKFSGQGVYLAASAGVTLTEAGGTYEVTSLAVSPVPDQIVTSLDDLAAGIKPVLVVSNLETMVELVLGTDYTVSYANNTSSGIATATATGAGVYAGMLKSVNFIIHAAKEVDANYNLSADEDWTGFESATVASGFVIDLKGHNLTISGLNGSGTITDSVGGGELHYYVPAAYASGYEAKIEGVSLTGGLKLVKEGPGKLTAIKRQQTYTGGTVVDAGILKYGCTGNNSVDSTYPFGYISASEKGSVSVNAGAILDPAGSHNWENHTITLNGGMISNTVAQTSGPFNPKLVLTADSTFASGKSYSLMVTSGDLNGHTLRVWFAHNGETLNFCPAGLENGTVYVVDGSWFKAASKNATAPTVDLSVYCALKMDSYSWTVRNYTARYNQNYGEGTAALNVLGTFTPEQNHFYGPTMQDGSAIDLSAKTGAWNVKGSLTYQNNGNGTTKFAAGATVAILLGERTPAYGEKIVSWTAATKPADSVSFTNATYFLHAKADGLYAEAPRTFAASDIPDIETAWTSADIVAAIESSLVVTNLVTGTALARGVDYTYAYVIDDGRCIVTITGHGGNEGLSVERTFDIGQILVKQSSFDYSIDISPNVGKVTGTLTNFPVLVRLSTDIEKFSYKKCRQDEIHFFLPDGTPLAHDVDYWNENGESTVWVNIPELTSNTVFRACWGLRAGQGILPPITSKSWPEYVGVWHFSEESGIVHDSSGNRYHSTNDGNGMVSNVNAKVGLARNVSVTRFNTGVTDLTSIGAVKPISNVARFTISGWMLSTENVGASGTQKYPDLMRKGQWSGNGWYACFEEKPTKFNGVGTGGTRTIVTIPASVYNNWVYLTVVFNDASCSVYEDGAFVQTYAIDKVKNSTYELSLANALTGRIDEYRIHNRVDDAAYIAADYATQTDHDFLTFGKIESHSGFFIILR